MRMNRVTVAAGLGLLAATPGLTQSTPQSRLAREIDTYLQRAVALGQFSGNVLAADEGRIVYQNAFGEANREWGTPNTLDTRFEIASMTKAITAIVIFQLVQEGKVRLDGRVSEYVPFYPPATGNQITVDQLLDHTSGLQQDIAFPDDANPFSSIIAAINADLLTNDSLVKLIAQRPLRFDPGTSYGYSSDAYAVLGAIIEHVTRTPYWAAIKTRVFDRAGMKETGVSLLGPIVRKRASGYAQTFDGYVNAPHIGVTAAGGLYSTLRDLYALDRALYTDTLVQASAKERIFAVRDVATAYGWKTSEESRPDGGTRRIFRTTGGLPGFGSLMVRIPSENRVVILLGNTRDLTWRLDEFAIAINRILDGEPHRPPRASAADVLAQRIRQGSRGAALRNHLSAMIADTLTYDIREAELNRLGYHLLYAKQSPIDARQVFELNVAAFPRSANVYDSLAEAFLVSGDTVQAVTNYRRSLELDPNNTNAVEVLKRITAP